MKKSFLNNIGENNEFIYDEKSFKFIGVEIKGNSNRVEIGTTNENCHRNCTIKIVGDNNKIILKGITNFINDINKIIYKEYIYEIPTDFIDSLLELACNSNISIDRKLYSNLTFTDQIGGIKEKNCFNSIDITPKINLNNTKDKSKKGPLSMIFLKIEYSIIKIFISSRKLEKYKNSRKNFFNDSKNFFC